MSRRAPLNAIVRLYLESPEQPPEEGHVVETTTGHLYRVVTAQRSTVTGSDGAACWYLMVRVIPRGTILTDDVVHTMKRRFQPPRRRPSRRDRLAALRRDG